jgi:hypothetical protein
MQKKKSGFFLQFKTRKTCILLLYPICLLQSATVQYNLRVIDTKPDHQA